MNINFEVINPQIKSQVNFLEKLYNDVDFKGLISPKKDKYSYQNVTSQDIKEVFIKNPEYSKDFYLIRDNSLKIGFALLQINPGHLVVRDLSSGWISIAIGNKDYWGTGAAKLALDFLESRALGHGINRIEIGVFAFNQRSLNFFRKNKYKKIKLLKNYTFWKGKTWDSIRLEKYLHL